MNNMTKLVKLLDAVYGASDQKQSRLRKIGQSYDEDHNTHIIQLEYRYKRNDGQVVTKRQKPKKSALYPLLNALVNKK